MISWAAFQTIFPETVLVVVVALGLGQGTEISKILFADSVKLPMCISNSWSGEQSSSELVAHTCASGFY